MKEQKYQAIENQLTVRLLSYLLFNNTTSYD